MTGIEGFILFGKVIVVSLVIVVAIVKWATA